MGLLDPDTMFQERASIGRDLPAASSTSTRALGVVHPTRAFRIDRAELISDADYDDDATDYYTLTLQVGATVIASWSTQTSAQGKITAATPANMVLSATDANLVLAAAGVLTLVATKAASGANITVAVRVHGRYVS